MYFLAIVGDPDIRVGNWVPSYVLCRSTGNSSARSGWRVVDANGLYRNSPKVLVKTIEDKQIMIEFMSKFRTRKHGHNSKRFAYKNTKKFYPRGILCWFKCDEHGRQTGPAIMIKRVPDMSSKHYCDMGKHILDAELNRIPTTAEILTKDDKYVDLLRDYEKKVIPQ